MNDVFILSRIQFALNITFHILFPTITIALAWFLVYFRIQANRNHPSSPHWEKIYAFWVKIFALCFAIGVVSGITMSFQFGTNWPGFMQTVGNIAGPLLGYEVLSAFFLEATFLGVMLFGRKRVSPRMHTWATVLVALGTSLSAFWILVLNSWMHTPIGFEMRNGQAHVTDWLAILWNPSLPYRLTHMFLACGLTASFLVAGVSAYRLTSARKSGQRQALPDVHLALRFALTVAAVIIPLQIFVGDLHGLNTLKHQPAKVAAMEGLWQTETAADLRLFAIPNERTRSNDLEVKIPYLTGLILTHSLDKPVLGLNEFKDHPPVAPVFFAFRIMVGMGMLMLCVAWYGCWKMRRSRLQGLTEIGLSARMQKLLIALTFSGWVATLSGWYVTEMGRQPWLVTGVLRTSAAVSTRIDASSVQTSLMLYITLYIVLIGAFISTVFYMAKKANNAA